MDNGESTPDFVRPDTDKERQDAIRAASCTWGSVSTFLMPNFQAKNRHEHFLKTENGKQISLLKEPEISIATGSP